MLRTVFLARARRLSGTIGATVVLAGLVILSPGSASSGATTSGTCLPSRVSVAASVSSRPGGTSAQVTFTSRAYPNCSWALATGYQFLDASGSAIGPVVYAGSATATNSVKLSYGFQVIAQLTTMSGVQCTLRTAKRVRVLVPGQTRARRVALPATIGVCVGGTTKWTSVSVARPGAPRCVANQLNLSVGPGNGAAGTIYYPLRVRNISQRACVVSGIPVVRTLRSSGGPYVGTASQRLKVDSWGSPLRLAPNGIASAAFGAAETGNYPPSRCASANAGALAVFVSGARLVAPLRLSVCTKRASTHVSGWVPGPRGQV